eukprot:TRINITY_DN10089_c0_g1_i1.p1 TRINITY_DN10089_c0_g1~~TRINITY_DN10089_c0_g1_i1.p1  ORF type:complete len:174 (-),score=48.98 TRINITY_DN10089_c0_g1_i1:216-737(-)
MGNGAMQFAQQMYVRTEHQRKPLRQSVRYLPEDREDDERALNVNLDDGSDSDDSIEDEGVAKYRRRVRRRMMEAKQRKILYEAPPKEEIRDFDILVAEGYFERSQKRKQWHDELKEESSRLAEERAWEAQMTGQPVVIKSPTRGRGMEGGMAHPQGCLYGWYPGDMRKHGDHI